ncbi:transcriptional regulator, MerR family [Methylorubrum populi]|uniref:Transcriptional regulator, MerR family n=1 Tax=Methylorubrum populi TaxID=223967 RepID=A0A160PLN0_9HYPH|nr:MerR family transcriptional regulator [Methylorubrum populi]BAU93623.1 transcriptional regulator, MerR family [Methylorubrum populi]
MLISEFARATGLTTDTVRFYIRHGLLEPNKTSKGGRNPYSVFTKEHLRLVEDIRVGQMLGLSIKQMVALKKEQDSCGLPPERGREVGVALLRDLERKAEHFQKLAAWLKASIEWEDKGQTGPRPEMPPIQKIR